MSNPKLTPAELERYWDRFEEHTHEMPNTFMQVDQTIKKPEGTTPNPETLPSLRPVVIPSLSLNGINKKDEEKQKANQVAK